MPSFFFRAQGSAIPTTARRFFIEGFANSRSRAFRKSICAQEKVPTNFTKLTSTRLENNLIRHRGVRLYASLEANVLADGLGLTRQGVFAFIILVCVCGSSSLTAVRQGGKSAVNRHIFPRGGAFDPSPRSCIRVPSSLVL